MKVLFITLMLVPAQSVSLSAQLNFEDPRVIWEHNFRQVRCVHAADLDGYADLDLFNGASGAKKFNLV